MHCRNVKSQKGAATHMMAALARWAMGVASNTEVGKQQHAAVVIVPLLAA